MRIFVPGRLCLFGEHSDWAGTYRSINPKIGKGYALIVGTNQGIYAKVKQHPQELIFQATLNNRSRNEAIRLPMKATALLDAAKKGGFASYIAGTAYQILTEIKGIQAPSF